MEALGVLAGALQLRSQSQLDEYLDLRGRLERAVAAGDLVADHGPDHWRVVETHAAKMVPERVLTTVAVAELRLLLAACAAHDIHPPGRTTWAWLVQNPARWGLDQAVAAGLRRLCEAAADAARLGRMPRWLYLGGNAVDLHRAVAVLHVADRLDLEHTDCPAPPEMGEPAPDAAARWPHDIGLAVGLIDPREGRLRVDLTIAGREPRTQAETFFMPSCDEAIKAVRNILLSCGMPFRSIELHDLHARPSVNVAQAQEAMQARAGARRKPKRPFRFLDPFGEDEAHLFAARDDDVVRLCGRVLTSPLAVLTGEVGVGKTSLVTAGVLPWLRDHGYDGVYARCLHDPAEALLGALRERLGDETPAPTLADAAQALAARGEGPVVLVLDQSQELFTRLGSQTRLDFAEKVAELLSLPGEPAHVLLVVQREFFHRLAELLPVLPTIYGEVVSLPRLTRDQARLVIQRALGRFRLRYDELVITHVLDDLTTPEGILPVELQIVCDHLYDQIEEDDTHVGFEIYRRVGSAGRVLENVVESRLRAQWWRRQTLFKSILVNGVSAQRTKVLLTVEECAVDLGTDPRSARELLEELVRQRLLGRLRRGDRTYYELRHEYLAQWLEPYITDVERQAKDVDDLLHRELNNFERFGLLLDREKLTLIHQYRRRLSLTAEELELVIRSAAKERLQVDYWFSRAGELSVSQQASLCLDLLYAPEPDLREAVRHLIGRLNDQAVVQALLASLREADTGARETALDMLGEVGQQLVSALTGEDPAIAQQAAYALGQLGARHAVQPLVESAQSAPAAAVREQAVEALAEIDRVRSAELLLRSLRTGNETARWNAAMALGRLGRDAGIRERLRREAERREVSASLLFAYTRACVEGRQLPEAERLLRDLERRAVPERQRARLAQTWDDLRRLRAEEQQGALSWPMYRGSATGVAWSPASLALPLELKWEFATGDCIHSSPAVAGGTVFIGSDDGNLYALDADSGLLRWSCALSGPLRSSPCVLGNQVLVGAQDGGVAAVDLEAGQIIWQQTLGAGIESSIRGNGERVAVGTTDGWVVAFAPADGTVLWRRQLDGPVLASPALCDDLLVVGAADAGLVLLAATTGEEIARRPVSGGLCGSPVLLADRAIVGSGDGRVEAVGLDGALLWSAALNGAAGSSPAVAHGAVYIGSDAGEIACLDARSGERRWTFDTEGWVTASPTIASQTVFIGSQAGQLYALAAHNGEPLWRYRTGYSIHSTPAVADRRLFVALRFYNMCAFAENRDAENREGEDRRTWRLRRGGGET